MVSHVYLVLFIPLLICDFIDGYPFNGSLAFDILSKTQQNAVLQSIWQQEPSNFCNVVKPSGTYLLNKASIQYNFPPLLCVILEDASLRYLEATHPGESGNQKDIAQKIKTNSNSENFCVYMRNNTWSTTIEENKQWTSNFAVLMKNETECRRLCSPMLNEVNPLCAYALWLDLEVKDAKKLHEIPKVPIPTKLGSESSAGKNPPSLDNKQPSKGLVGQTSKSSSVGDNTAHDTSLGNTNLPGISPDALPANGLAIASHLSPNQLIESSHLHTKNTGNTGQNDIAGKANIEHSTPIKSLPKSPDSQDINQLNNDNLLKNQISMLKPDNSLPSKPAVHNSVPSDLSKEVNPERKNAHPVIPHMSKTASTAVSKEHTTTNDGSEDGRNRGEVTQVSQEGPAPPNQDALSDQRKVANQEIPETPTKISAGVDQSPPLKDKASAGDSNVAANLNAATSGASSVLEGANEDKEGVVDGADDEIDDHEDQKNEDMGGLGGEEEPPAPVAAMPPEEEVPDQPDASRFDNPEEHPEEHPAKPQDAPSKVNTNDAETSDDDDDVPLLEERGRTSQNDPDAGFAHDRFVEAEDSHFFAYFMTMIILCVLGYLIFHNKQKILALALEGRVRKGVRRRPSTSGYRKLDSNLEEAITSSCTGSSATHVIY